jgi:hypothetical protein
MRVMFMIKGDPEPGAAPSDELLAAMGRYNDELKTAGVLLDLAGLLPSAEGRRVKFSGGDRTVIDGPFPESKQLIAGYWILQVPSMDEAVEWAKRAPFEALSRIYPGEYGATGEIEIRRVFELEGSDASSYPWYDPRRADPPPARTQGQAVSSRPMPRASSHTDHPI